MQKENTEFYIISNAFIFLMSKQLRQNIIDTLKNAFISQMYVDTFNTKKNHTQYMKDTSSGFLSLIRSRSKSNSKS